MYDTHTVTLGHSAQGVHKLSLAHSRSKHQPPVSNLLPNQRRGQGPCRNKALVVAHLKGARQPVHRQHMHTHIHHVQQEVHIRVLGKGSLPHHRVQRAVRAHPPHPSLKAVRQSLQAGTQRQAAQARGHWEPPWAVEPQRMHLWPDAACVQVLRSQRPVRQKGTQQVLRYSSGTWVAR